MATASDGHASIVTAGSSSFGQYRLTQFVAGGGPNDATYPQRILSSVNSDAPQMAQSSRPSSGQNIERTPSTAPARSTPQELLTYSQADSSTGAGFGTLELVELASNPTLEGILGPNKDGRVRNPVPSKLKGKTDNKQGNFGVMHMGMSPGKTNNISGRDIASERDAAARRTSENTASRAKAAQQDKYAPPKRRGLEGMDSRSSPFAHERQRASRPLAPDETKFEQARLLTLLRSINPVTVVDQICKAVAYFGGIPGAPPPEDGIFPESANTRETGALFIGWLAEIFPDLSSSEVPKMQAPPVKKFKGRPTKPETDVTPAAEAPNPRNGFGYGQAVGAPAWGLPQSLALVNTPDVGHPLASGISQQPPVAQPEQPRPSTPSKQQLDDTSGVSTEKRGRGRPKGSRNKGGKPNSSFKDDGGEHGENGTSAQIQPISLEQDSSPVLEKLAQPESIPYAPMNRPAPNPAQTTQQVFSDQTWQTSNQQKSQAEQEWQINNQRKLLETQAKPPAAGIGDELSPEEQAVLRAFRGPDVQAQATPIVPNATPAKGTQAGGVKRKRGPNKPKVPPAVPQNAQGEQCNNSTGQAANSTGQNSFSLAQTTASMGQNTNSMAQTPAPIGQKVNTQKPNAIPMSNNNVGAIATDQLQWAPVDSSTTTAAVKAAPAPKRQRQRKPKVPAPPVRADSPSLPLNNSMSKPSSVGTATPKVPPSTIPDSQASSTQQSTQVTRPPAEGLEAHYERFANLPQQNGRSHTPTITPQQQIRNQQTSSAPPQSQQLQQPPAQQQSSTQQHQMQHQKSQQGSQRDDQKTTQGATSRSSSSSGFYSQRNQGPSNYAQQYSSHQPSQLYGHQSSLSQSSLGQASPQMNSNANSYIASKSHTLAQASPQFSQAENTYKTASPHTITQPSPSYTQPDATYRSSTSHTLAQPSPQFSAAENPYRTSSTHSVQPSTSYTRPGSQAQSSHQGHYSGYADNPYVDLPTLESLGHSGSSNSASVGMGTGAYGQNMSLNSASTRPGSNSLYGTSAGLNSAFDTGTNDLLRGVSRSSVSNSVYGTSPGMGTAFDPTVANEDMRERIMRNLGRR